jgi:hypothetical protein
MGGTRLQIDAAGAALGQLAAARATRAAQTHLAGATGLAAAAAMRSIGCEVDATRATHGQGSAARAAAVVAARSYGTDVVAAAAVHDVVVGVGTHRTAGLLPARTHAGTALTCAVRRASGATGAAVICIRGKRDAVGASARLTAVWAQAGDPIGNALDVLLRQGGAARHPLASASRAVLGDLFVEERLGRASWHDSRPAVAGRGADTQDVGAPMVRTEIECGSWRTGAVAHAGRAGRSDDGLVDRLSVWFADGERTGAAAAAGVGSPARQRAAATAGGARAAGGSRSGRLGRGPRKQRIGIPSATRDHEASGHEAKPNQPKRGGHRPVGGAGGRPF